MAPKRVDEEVHKRFAGKTEAAKGLGIDTIDEYSAWRQSELFKPHFDILWNGVLKPLADAAASDSRDRKREMNFNLVESVLIDEDCGGQRRFFMRNPTKDKWEIDEHYALALYCIREDNTHHFNGIFYGKRHMSKHEKHVLIWRTLALEVYEMAPSRVAKRENPKATKRKAGTVIGGDAKRGKPLSTSTANSTISTAPIVTPPLSSSTPAPSIRDRLVNMVREGSGGRKKIASPIIASEESFPTDEEYVPFEPEDPEAAEFAENLVPEVPSDEVEVDNLARIRQSIKEREEDKERQDRYLQAYSFGLSRADVLKIERRHETFNLDDDYWKNDLMVRLESGFKAMRSLQDEPGYVLPTSALELGAEDLAWNRSLSAQEGSSHPSFEQSTQQDREAYLKNQLLLDNEMYQPQDHMEACAALGIANPQMPRFPSMPRNMHFKFWQVVAIRHMLKQRRTGLKGSLICDTMGLGKTIMTLALILARNHQRDLDLAAGRPVESARPLIIVTLPSLVEQWYNEIKQVSPKFIRLKYYGETRGRQPGSFKGILDKDHPIFNSNDPEIQWKAILTTPQTLQSRHGPSTQTSWRIKTLNMEPKIAHSLKSTLDPKWPQNLSGLFDTCIIDEAHSVKNAATQQHISCKWLEPGFYALATATPDLNSVRDVAGYVPFIAPNLLPEELTARMKEWNVTENVNPYELPDDHPATILRAREAFFQRHVVNQAITDPTIIGAGLRKFYGACMIRRTHVSIVDGKKISDDMVPLVHRRAICEFTNAERKVYDGLAEVHTKRLYRHDPKTDRPSWNWRHYRMLLLLSTWTGFYYIENKLKASETAKLLKKINLLYTIVKWYCAINKTIKVPNEDDVEGLLKVVYFGAPKIRALMKLVRQVVLNDQKKMVIFTSLPAQQVLLYAIFQAIQISSAVYGAHLNAKEKSDLQARFNNEEEPMVLIGSYAVTSCGLNLQRSCHWGAFLDPPPSKSIGEQAGARIHRVGQTETVELVTFSTKGSFNDRQYLSNLKKAIPGLLASLSRNVFGTEIQTTTAMDGELQPELGEWVKWEGHLIRADDPRLPEDHDLKRLSGFDLVKQILANQMGTPLEVKESDEFGDVPEIYMDALARL